MKTASPNEEQRRILKEKGYNPLFIEILQDYQNSMIIKNRFTGMVELVEKK